MLASQVCSSTRSIVSQEIFLVVILTAFRRRTALRHIQPIGTYDLHRFLLLLCSSISSPHCECRRARRAISPTAASARDRRVRSSDFERARGLRRTSNAVREIRLPRDAHNSPTQFDCPSRVGVVPRVAVRTITHRCSVWCGFRVVSHVDQRAYLFLPHVQ
jgi:hypothetical protein